MAGIREVGDWIADRYEIYDIHLGGMGVVYVVYDHQGAAGQRVLALKTLRDELLTDSKQVSRFISECQTWIKLDRHPNIVRAYSVQQLEGKPYVLMELVTGGTLRKWIGTPELDVPRILRFGIHFCLGMEHSVQKGLHCHRDIKPENLLITDGGTLKITDFGLAKVWDESADSDRFSAIPLVHTRGATVPTLPTLPDDHGPIQVDQSSSAPARDPVSNGDALETVAWQPNASQDAADEGHDDLARRFLSTVDLPGTMTNHTAASEPPQAGSSRSHRPAPPLLRSVTLAGAMVGTGPYMAPEQFRDAKHARIQADVYAFGVVLFEMITGARPFQGDTLLKLARQHAREAPPSVAPFIPKRYSRAAKAMDRIVGRCLAKDPARRFASLGELRHVLATLLRKLTGEQVVIPAETELEAWELTSKGVSLGTLGRFDEERTCYEESIRIKPDYVPAWFNQAAASGALGRPDEAVAYADVALRLSPESVPALINKGLALSILHRPERAISCFDLALRLQPRYPEAWYGRGVILLNQGNFDGAKAAFDQAIRLRPEFPEAIDAAGAAILKTHLHAIAWVRRTEDTKQ